MECGPIKACGQTTEAHCFGRIATSESIPTKMLQRITLLLGLIAICGATVRYGKPVGLCLYGRQCRDPKSQVCFRYKCYCKPGYTTVRNNYGRYSCVLACPIRKYYNRCPTACPINCDNYYNQPTKCTKNCRPGVNCVCKKGYIEKSSTDFRCVRPKDCPKPCDNVECDKDEKCYEKTGECVDLCYKVECGKNQECKKGKCVCKKGYKPVGNKCVELCFGVKCGKYEKCDKNTGECVGLCVGVECGKFRKCNKKNGKCVDLCYDVECDDDEKCNKKTGKCVDLCYDVECDDDEKCNKKNGQCVGLCYGVKCGQYKKCDDKTGRCVGLCYGVKCRQYEKCDDKTGRCVGLCYGVKCGPYKKCNYKTGVCVGSCYDVKCGVNEVCRAVDGECVCVNGYRRFGKGPCVRYYQPPVY